MANTYPSLTKVTCNECGSEFIKKPSRWKIDTCPMCTLKIIHAATSWMPGTDAVFYSKTNVFFVVEIPTLDGMELKIYDGKRYNKHKSRYPELSDPYFQGSMKDCVNYVKANR